MSASVNDIGSFRRMIFAWWKTHRRDLPWRHTRDPYKILVSEVMLQQTQVSRVLPKYAEFLGEFPTVHALAKATSAHVLRAWRGMGYNRRALYLKKTAEAVVSEYHGIFPDSESQLMKLPGLGKYTARAIMVFAFEKDVGMVDTNIRHIITHFLYKGLPQKEKIIEATADQIVPKGKSWEWHQALMDYGALAMQSEKKSMKLVKKQTSFKDSNRFYRGRIVDMLRSGKTGRTHLLLDLTKKYGKDKKFIKGIISGLIRDGLVVVQGTSLSLPT